MKGSMQKLKGGILQKLIRSLLKIPTYNIVIIAGVFTPK